MDGRSIGYEKTISTEYLEKIAEAYSNFFHFKYSNQLLIINNENLDILEDPGAVRMLIDKIDQMTLQIQTLQKKNDDLTTELQNSRAESANNLNELNSLK